MNTKLFGLTRLTAGRRSFRAAMFCCLLFSVLPLCGKTIPAGNANYTTFLSSLQPGDTLLLSSGTYTGNLTLKNLSGTALNPIVILGRTDGSVIFEAQSCCNTISITQCAWLVIRDLKLDGKNLAVDAVKGEGTADNWAHDITVENLDISGYGNNQQIVGISTKCPAWNWVIRNNKITGAGTGMYLGNSDGSKPFVNGLIEYNLIQNTLGYNIEIKHQTDTVRDNIAGTRTDGQRTIIRYNVFSKESGASAGSNARPNLLVGGLPQTGYGKNDVYEIYGNFFWQNPTEALFQATGNVNFHHNILVNHNDPAGYRAVYFKDHNGVKPQKIKVFQNTIYAINSSGVLRLYNPDNGYRQYCYANAVFGPQAITGFTDTSHNITDAYANAGNYVNSVSATLSGADFYPKAGKLNTATTTDTAFTSCTDYQWDFNRRASSWNMAGAYGASGTNPGWHLALERRPYLSGSTRVFIPQKPVTEVFPNPSAGAFTVQCNQNGYIIITNAVGQLIQSKEIVQGQNRIVLPEMGEGMYLWKLSTPGGILSGRLLNLPSR
ncbi:MAG: T9SS type A sorting domain-containing protein [Bacteroidetes bacterium]|nr:T9SS type A sorting domain-containing protein [Bacteroidota bacterium]